MSEEHSDKILSDFKILEALQFLAKTYPEDRVDIWVQIKDPKAPEIVFTAYISDRSGLPSVFGNSPESAMAAAKELVSHAGLRGGVEQLAAKQREIDNLRTKLSRLESELDPLVGALAVQQTEAKK